MIRIVSATLLVTGLFTASAAAVFIYAGGYNVAATAPHWPVTYRLMETTRVRSIKTRAAGITVPPGVDEPAKVAAAAGHFAAHCAMCHGAPGIERGDFARGMYPQPPDLTEVSKRYTPAQLFWIIRNGLKMSGMPSMADDGDDLLWATVGLLEQLPRMTPASFNNLIVASRAQDNHKDMRGMNMGGEPSGQPGEKADPDAAPGPQHTDHSQ